MAEEYPDGSAAALYESRTQFREPFLRRGEEAAELTLPSLMPRMGTNGATTLHSPFQSVGSRGLKNLAAKLLLALFPANAPFFRESIDETTQDELSAGDPKAKTEIEAQLNKVERTAMTHIEQTPMRVTAAETLLHLLGIGNGLFYIPEDGQCRLFPLSSYIACREPSGKLLYTITKEEVSREVLTEKQKALLEANEIGKEEEEADPKKAALKTVKIFTKCMRTSTQWDVTQELNGFEDEDARGHYPLDASAYIALRFRKIDGQDYGRGFVEENIGDLRSLEGLSQSLVEAAAAAAKMLILVNPNGYTSKKTVANSPNLAVRDGRPEDVGFMRSEKTPDLNWAAGQAERIEKRLELSFLLHSAVSRDAERVTAEEIRYLAQELDDGLGATYSILSQDWQLPVVMRFMNILQKTKKLPILPKSVKPQIISGLEALGRGHDLNRLYELTRAVKEIVQPTEVATYLDVTDVLKKICVAIGLDTKSVRSPEDVAAAQQQAQQASMMEKGTPNAVKGVADAYAASQAGAAAAPPPAQ